ncbi:MAG: hypothetical protein JSR97_11665 [Verrucomicrobia bacterium]|nr:hypothetical protein [Verrucomicrobiota bacterium]
MHWKNVYGTYVPCYLLINLKQTNVLLTDIKDIDERDKRIFFHENTHFLQNITGGFGHSHIWYTYDRMRQIVSDLQKNAGNEITIPVKNPVTQYQELLADVMRSMEGSYHARKPVDDNTAFAEIANMYLNESFQKLYPGKKLYFLNLQLEDDRKQKADYSFGESAVSETMAYLMESKHFGEEKVANFPYKACQKVAGYIGTDFTDNKEWLFALCDMAMVCNYPGMAFYTMLLDMHHQNFKPQNTEEIYTEGEKLMKARGWDIWKDFETNKNNSIHVIKELFNHPIFKETLDWFIYILETGFKYRKENPYFMLNLYREESPFEGSWADIYTTFGTPQLHNAEQQRFFRAPLVMKDIEAMIEPLYLLSMKQVHDTLYHGKPNCDLIECCRGAKVGPEVDYRCKTEPWLRAKDEKTCAYGAQWMLFGLADKKVV